MGSCQSECTLPGGKHKQNLSVVIAMLIANGWLNLGGGSIIHSFILRIGLYLLRQTF